ncbi:MAG: hypothetical protein QF752_11560 [Planctomycetota bacterium]|nr:hypothetical protein [Planctomycetota bacterium]
MISLYLALVILSGFGGCSSVPVLTELDLGYWKTRSIEEAQAEARRRYAWRDQDGGRSSAVLYEWLCRQVPNGSELAWESARTFAFRGEWERALEKSNGAVESDPVAIDPRLWRAISWLGFNRNRSGDRVLQGLPRTRGDLLWVISRKPRESRAHVALGEWIVLAHRLGWSDATLSEAKAYFQTAMELRPGLPTAYLNLVRLHLVLRERGRAKGVLSRLRGTPPEEVTGPFYPDAQRLEWNMACGMARVLEQHVGPEVHPKTGKGAP